MGKAVKHSAKLRRKSWGTIFRKRVFKGNQNTPVSKAAALKQLTNITNRRDSENVLSASARKLQSLNKVNISTATTDVNNINKSTRCTLTILMKKFDNETIKLENVIAQKLHNKLAWNKKNES